MTESMTAGQEKLLAHIDTTLGILVMAGEVTPTEASEAVEKYAAEVKEWAGGLDD